MASKEEKTKKKAERDDRWSGKDNVGRDEFRKPKRLKCKSICFTVTVYGHPHVVQMVLQHSETLELKTMQYKVYITVVNGNDWVGRPSSDGADLILCVYDVCNAQTASYLKDYVLPYMKENRKIMAIAGIGLENRKLGGASLTDVGACLQLCRLYGCHGSEVVGSRGFMPASGYNNRNLAVVGLGAECRTPYGRADCDPSTCQMLANHFKCHGTEVVSWAGPQLAAGLCGLLGATHPERFKGDEGDKKGGKK